MNKIYRVVWNKATQTWAAVCEYAKAQGKSSGSDVVGEMSDKRMGGRFAYTMVMSGLLIATGQVAYAATVADGTGLNAIVIQGASSTATATGADSLAAGTNAAAAGNSALAIGTDSKATGDYATAVGANVTAGGLNSITICRSNNVTGRYTTVIGSGNIPKDGKELDAAGGIVDVKAADTITATHSSIIGKSNQIAVSSVIGTPPPYAAVLTDVQVQGNDNIINRGHAFVFGSNNTINTDASNKELESVVAVGRQNTVSGNNSLAVGRLNTVAGDSALAVGINSQALGRDGIAIGNKAYASKSENPVALGGLTHAGQFGTALGARTSVEGDQGLAAATGAVVKGARAVAVGSYSFAGPEDAVALGHNTAATGSRAVAMGAGSVVSGARSGAWGIATNGGQPQNNTTDRSFVGGADSYAIGNKNIIGNTSSDSFVLGNNVKLGATGASIAITNVAGRDGTTNASTRTNAVTYTGATAITGAVALGSDTSVTVDNGVALGKGSVASTAAGQAGTDPLSAKDATASAGVWTATHAAVSVGNGTTVTRQITSVAAGTQDTDAVNVAQLKAAGFTLAATASDGELGGAVANDKIQNGETVTVDAGKNIKVTHTANQVSIATKDEVEFTKITLGDSTNKTVLTSTTDGLDVGGDKITNVANGNVTSTSKDAINGSQLRNTADDIASIIGGNATVDNAGNVTASNIGGTTATTIDDAIKTVKTTVKSTDNTIKVTANTADATNGTVFDISVDAQKLAESAQLPVVYTDADGNKVYKVNGKFTKDPTGQDVSQEVTATNVIASMQNADGTISPTTLANIKAGTNDTDAVNVSQLKGAVDALGGGAAINTDGTIKAPTYNITNPANGTVTTANNVGDALSSLNNAVNSPLTFKGDSGEFNRNLGQTTTVKGGITDTAKLSDNNIGVVAKDGTLDIKLAKDIAVDSVKTGDTTVNTYGVSIVNADPNKVVSLTADGLNNGNNRITNVAAGTDDTDAVNVSQLKAVEATANQGWNLTTNGKAESKSNVKPGDTVDFNNTDGNVKIENTGNNVTVDLNKDIKLAKDGSVTIGDTKVNNDGLTIVGGPSVTKSGIDAGDKKITKLADGEISATSKDAVNGSQLYQAVNNINADIAASKEEVTSNDKSVKVTTTQNAKGANVYDLSVNTDGTTIKKNADGSLAVNTTPLTNTDGKVNTPAAPNALATAGDIADAINNSGWKATSGATGSGVVNGTTEELINPSETVTFQAGDNMVLNQAGNVFTYSLNKDITIGKDGKPGSIGVAGQDGKDGVSIKGDTGKDGEPGEATITVGRDGKDGDAGIDGKVGVNGKDGSAVVLNGKDGSIGLNGKDGKDGLSLKSADGAEGVDGTNGADGLPGKDGKTRLVYQPTNPDGTPNGDPEQVATLNDGLIFTGNNEELNRHKLNTVVKVVGEGVDKAASAAFKSATGNINVVADKKDTLEIQLNRDLKDLGSATFVEYNTDGTVNNEAPKTTVNNNGITITPKDGKDGKDGNVVSVTKDGLNNGGNQIVNVDSGLKDADGKPVDVTKAEGDILKNAVNVSDLKTVATDAFGLKDKEGNEFKQNLGTTAQITGDKNINTKVIDVKNDAGEVTGKALEVSLNNDITIGKDGKPGSIGVAGQDGKDGVSIKGDTGKDGEPGEATITVGRDGKDGDAGIDGKVGVNGKDGASVVLNGKDGSIGLTGPKGADGKPGANASIQVKDGAEGVNGTGKDGLPGENGQTRIVYETKDKDGNTLTEQLANLNDGLIFTGNNEDTLNRHKLNTVVKVQGEGVDKAASQNFKSAAGNINVKANGSDLLEVQLSKNLDLTDGGSVKMGDTTVNSKGLTIKNGPSVTQDGINAGGKKVTNVADGKEDTDAVNVRQLKGAANALNNKINRNNREARAGIAGSNAAAALPQVYIPGKSMVAASAGTFKGESAVAVGYSRSSDNGKVILKLQGNANTRGDFGAGVGVGYQW